MSNTRICEDYNKLLRELDKEGVFNKIPLDLTQKILQVTVYTAFEDDGRNTWTTLAGVGAKYKLCSFCMEPSEKFVNENMCKKCYDFHYGD